ncbi:CAP domain-containing protein [Bacillus massiliglaciei]|uniref:CAP domain-containing protein n=1 Tax=Bacillus massiliglaciei TaxID=1816693 RepID=UPI000A950669|nr:CAP domain-containing protein [Bacillus massiliglaciei]
MRKLLVLLLVVGGFWFAYGKDIPEQGYQGVFENIKEDANGLKNNAEISSALTELKQGAQQLWGTLSEKVKPLDSGSDTEAETVSKPELEKPADHSFSVHNIELGDSKSDVEKKAGKAKRSSENEYGTKWFTYHDNYHNFFMAAYNDDDKVSALYTNQDLISSKQGIERGTPKKEVEAKLGEPLTKLRKGNVFYQIQNNGEYGLYKMENSYVTVFYDKHENNTVTSIQIVDQKLEEDKKDYFTPGDQKLKQGFEFQLFDLTNAARVNHNLNVLTWNEEVQGTARKHSDDMAENNYFDHTNLAGKSPFDRMADDDIAFRLAGENLAAGQNSSIFAHEGLMNSLGHRENILRKDFRTLGVGVAFNNQEKPYYTENYVTN